MPKTLSSFVIAACLVATSTAAQVAVPPGYEVDVFASGLSFITGLAFDGDGVLHVSEANIFTSSGRILRIEDLDGDGSGETITEFAGGFGLAIGIAFRGRDFPIRPPACPRHASSPSSPSSAATDLERIRRGTYRGQQLDLFVSHYIPGTGGEGFISVVRDDDRDGVADSRDEIVTGLPSDGDNGTGQIAVGPGGKLYFAQGARTNAGVPGGGPADGPLNATILRVNADGSDLEVYAAGLRNAYDLAFAPDGTLFATENGPDPSGPSPILGAPDELNAIHRGGDYGWPDHFGFPPAGSGTIGPLAEFGASTSTDGIAVVTPTTFCGFEGDLIAAQFGSFSDLSIGRKLVNVRLLEPRGLMVDVFATGFGRPLDVAFGADGALYVADFSNPFLSPGSAVIYRIRPIDSDDDGIPDVCMTSATATGSSRSIAAGRSRTVAAP